MPEFKLHYFDFTGRAEPIRMILSYGGIKFEDIRVGHEDFVKMKPTLPLGQLPVLEIDGKMIPQSTAISRYLATLTKLDGNDAKENLRIDVATDTLLDLQQKLYDFAFEKDEEKKKTLEPVLANETVPFFLKKFDEKAGENGGFIAIKRISWADISFICVYESMRNILKKDMLADYPNLIKTKNNILAVPNLREYIKSRPEHKMYTTFDLKQEL
ncbi:unnamed protein product [Phaedon cochleariae]|uniref:glutathione transferase n=1 Tax=Phaedon cochleariae TaxID=80249 RepID=A0A9N9SKV1_PHACE|nr:unnamed protein product [Phaedon cochleariae]